MVVRVWSAPLSSGVHHVPEGDYATVDPALTCRGALLARLRAHATRGRSFFCSPGFPALLLSAVCFVFGILGAIFGHERERKEGTLMKMTAAVLGMSPLLLLHVVQVLQCTNKTSASLPTEV